MSEKSPLKRPAYLIRLKQSLERDLAKVGLKPKSVVVEPVEGTKLYRILVISPSFRKLGHFERQDLVWKIIENTLGRDERLHVSIIRTLTPSEAEEAA